MKHLPITPEALARKMKEERRGLKERDYLRKRKALHTGAGALLGSTPTLILPLASEVLVFDDEEARAGVDPLSAALSTGLGAFCGLSYSFIRDRAGRKKAKKAAARSLLKTSVRARRDLDIARGSFNNLFGYYIDGFEAERELYDALYTARVEEAEVIASKRELERLYKEASALKEEIAAIEEKIRALPKEDEEDEIVPAYPGNEPERKVLARELRQKREALDALESDEVTEHERIIEKSKKKKDPVKDKEKALALTIANRKAREGFSALFISGLASLLLDLNALEKERRDPFFTLYYLKAVNEQLDIFEAHFEDFKTEVEALMKKAMGITEKFRRKAQGRRADSLAYADAPFKDTFLFRRSVKDVKGSFEYRLLLKDIREGVAADLEAGRKGTYLLQSRFSHDWRHEVGDFTRKEELELSDILRVDVARLSLEEADAKYRGYMKENHPDVQKNPDLDKIRVAGELMKKYRAFKKNQERIDSLYKGR